MDDVVIAALRKSAIDMRGARDQWLDTLWQALDDAGVYTATAQLQSKVSDIVGIRRALERASVHFRIARESLKRIEEIDAGAAQ